MGKKPKSQLPLALSVGGKVLGAGFRMPLTVLEGPNKRGEWLVSGASIKIWVHEKQLKPLAPSASADSAKAPRGEIPSSTDLAELDLHGMRAHEAEEALLEALDSALVRGVQELHVIHGRGTGTLRELVGRFAATHKQISGVRQHPTNPGVTIWHLR